MSKQLIYALTNLAKFFVVRCETYERANRTRMTDEARHDLILLKGAAEDFISDLKSPRPKDEK